MTGKFIADFQPSQTIVTFAAIRSIWNRTKRSGEEFLALELQDRTGTIEAKIWEVEEPMRQLRAGNYVKVKGRVEDYRGTLQLAVEKIRKVSEADRQHGFRESDLVISTPYDIDAMWGQLQALVQREVADPFIRQLLKNVLERNEERFKYFPAAQEIHHGYRGGFLEHVLSVTQSCAYFSGRYPQVDKDLLIAGGILHDIGKLQELTAAPAVEYTAEGRLIGHIILGRDLVRAEAARIPDFPEKTLLLIEHIIVSHHGSYDLGSPKRPKILEALILHYLDDMDAKVNHFQATVRAHRGPGPFTGYDRILGRVLYKEQRPSVPCSGVSDVKPQEEDASDSSPDGPAGGS